LEDNVISVEEAGDILHNNIPEPIPRLVALEQAYNCYLSEDIPAPDSSPRYTNSAMDGFALRWQDCSAAAEETPASLKVMGESQAGIPFEGIITSGTAVRISTGAMLPTGADTVVRVKDTREDGKQVEVLAVRFCGQNVRYEGEEFEKDTILFHKGECLRARELTLLAAVGLHQVPVLCQERGFLQKFLKGGKIVPGDDIVLDVQE
jgi:molybdopterin molybdotransferase